MLKDYKTVEDSKIDFKEMIECKKPKSWLKSVSAFANCDGGILLFGVSDGGDEVGLEDAVNGSEKISELINERIKPLPRYELKAFSEDGKDFIELNVGDGPKTPYYYDYDGRKEAFVRAGNQSIPAPKHILDNLILRGQNTTFDELITSYKLSDFSFTLLNVSLKKETGVDLDINKDFLSFNLSDDKGFLTNAGLLLSDQGPLVQSRIFCTRWKGLTKSSVDVDALDDKEYTGSIIYLLDSAIAFIKNNSHKSWHIKDIKRIEVEDYPSEAVREAIVNAIIHRDYQIVGSEIHIDMYDDRLEITSPGGMIDGSFIQDLDISCVSSMRRNRIISDMFNRLHFMDRRGSGLSRIILSYDDFNIKPTFNSGNLFFRVIFPNKGYDVEKPRFNDAFDKRLNVVSDDDYFLVQLHKCLPRNTKSITIDNIKFLFSKYGFNDDFKRSDIENILNLKKTRVLSILDLLLKFDLIEKTSISRYKFKKWF